MIDKDNWEDYFIKGTNTLKNKLKIQNKEELRKKEIELTFLRQIELLENPIIGNFDPLHLNEIHYYLFQDIYDFAGKFRTTNIQKNDSPFLNYQEIYFRLEILLEQIQEDLKNIYAIYDFSCFLAHLFIELTYIHPYREGNGRCIREFIREYTLEISKNFSFGPLEFLWSNVCKDVFEQPIHYYLVFPSAIELEFSKALVPINKKTINSL